MIAIHRRLRARWPDLLLLWAPRHPERFRAVAQTLRRQPAGGWRRAALTQWPRAADDAVFVIDTLGELMRFYACADVAFVGGSLQAIGGHNLLEPAAIGTAIVTGPHLHNFSEIAKRLEDSRCAACIARDADGVGAAVEALLADAAARAAHGRRRARAWCEEGRGALARTLEMIAPALPARGTALSRAIRARGDVRADPPARSPVTAARRCRGAARASASAVSRRLMSCTSATSSVPAACSSSSRFCRKL